MKTMRQVLFETMERRREGRRAAHTGIVIDRMRQQSAISMQEITDAFYKKLYGSQDGELKE